MKRRDALKRLGALGLIASSVVPVSAMQKKR